MTRGRKRESLLQSVGTQDALPGVLGEFAARGEFTGELFFSSRPDSYRACAALLSQGVSVPTICRVLNIHHNTVIAVRDREGMLIDRERELIASHALAAARGAIDRVVDDVMDDERMARTSTRDKAIVAGVLVDKGMLLAGQATQRIEIVHDDRDAFADFLAEVRDITSDVSGATSEMDYCGEAAAQRGDAGAGAPAGTDTSAGMDESRADVSPADERDDASGSTR